MMPDLAAREWRWRHALTHLRNRRVASREAWGGRRRVGDTAQRTYMNNMSKKHIMHDSMRRAIEKRQHCGMNPPRPAMSQRMRGSKRNPKRGDRLPNTMKPIVHQALRRISFWEAADEISMAKPCLATPHRSNNVRIVKINLLRGK